LLKPEIAEDYLQMVENLIDGLSGEGKTLLLGDFREAWNEKHL
jgi:hypothetical protein